jgi:hypothetical protein
LHPRRSALPVASPVFAEAFVFSWCIFALLTFTPVGDGEVLCLCRTPRRVFVSHGEPLDPVGSVLKISDRGEVVLSGVLVSMPNLREALEQERARLRNRSLHPQLPPLSRILLDIDSQTPMSTVKGVLRACAAADIHSYELVVETVRSWTD